MSSIKLESNASGTGIFTIASPNSNTNRTLTLPNSAGTVATQEYIPTALNASGSAPIYAARAWVNFNGTGTPAIRASGNVSSITDNGTGDYTVNFTTAMPDADYSVTTSGFESQGSYVTSGFGIRSGTAPTTSSVRGSCVSYAGSYVDPTYVLVVIFR
jgi:hypothetical protein